MDQLSILLMVQKSGEKNHLGCIKPRKSWDKHDQLPIKWCIISPINSIIAKKTYFQHMTTPHSNAWFFSTLPFYPSEFRSFGAGPLRTASIGQQAEYEKQLRELLEERMKVVQTAHDPKMPGRDGWIEGWQLQKLEVVFFFSGEES